MELFFLGPVIMTVLGILLVLYLLVGFARIWYYSKQQVYYLKQQAESLSEITTFLASLKKKKKVVT